MSVFRFKKFDVVNERSAMKVNTDAVLLGAATEVTPNDRDVLDIGTGTGVVALMIAQRLSEVSGNYHVQGIDIDAPSAEEASLNFRNSLWSGRLEAVHTSLGSFISDRCYDLIISNPPYYDNSLQAPDKRRNAARHTGATDVTGAMKAMDATETTGVMKAMEVTEMTEAMKAMEVTKATEETELTDVTESLSYREVLGYSISHLKPEGRVSLILPADQEKDVTRQARTLGFALWRMLKIKTVPRKLPSRIIVQFKKRNSQSGARDGRCLDFREEELTLSDERGKRASQQASLVTDYLL